MAKNLIRKKSWKSEFASLVDDSLSYIGQKKVYIYLAIIIFFASAVFAFFNSSQLTMFDKFLEEISNQTQNLDFLEMVWFIFSNNITSSIIVLFLGAVFGIFPIFNAVFNGAILGYVYAKAVPIGGFSIIWRLIPHGIFELPAIFITFGLGINLGFSFFGKNKIKNFKERFTKSLHAFLTVVLPLLMIAAIIESALIFFVG